MKKLFLAACLLLAFSLALPAAKTFDMYVIDTEGGKSLLLISPSGQSMLIDTGFPGFEGRDTSRILEAANAAGAKKIDILVTTHYDGDHVANTPDLVAKLPVGTFIDHGPAVVTDARTTASVKAYTDLAEKAKHVVVKPGDKIPFGDVEALVVMAGGVPIKTPIKGAGRANKYCAETQPKTWPRINEDASENGASVGILFTYGNFKMLDLADLTWNKEVELMCPNNPVGLVDLWMVSHHGNDISNSPAVTNALGARVAIMNNGVKKIGAASVIKMIKMAPGLQDLYQMHWSANAPNDNTPDEFIANLQDSPDGKWIKVSVDENGAYTVTNGRTEKPKRYGK